MKSSQSQLNTVSSALHLTSVVLVTLIQMLTRGCIGVYARLALTLTDGWKRSYYWNQIQSIRLREEVNLHYHLKLLNGDLCRRTSSRSIQKKRSNGQHAFMAVCRVINGAATLTCANRSWYLRWTWLGLSKIHWIRNPRICWRFRYEIAVLLNLLVQLRPIVLSDPTFITTYGWYGNDGRLNDYRFLNTLTPSNPGDVLWTGQIAIVCRSHAHEPQNSSIHTKV